MGLEILLIVVIAIAGMIVQGRLQKVFDKYSRVMFHGGLTGREVAEKMLRDHGIRDVRVTNVSGHLTDHYNPANKTLNLSDSVYNSNSVAAAAVAAHECGHAVQHAEGYAFLKMRSALVPIVQFSSMFAQIVIILGLIMMTAFPALYWIGIAMFFMIFLFSAITPSPCRWSTMPRPAPSPGWSAPTHSLPLSWTRPAPPSAGLHAPISSLPSVPWPHLSITWVSAEKNSFLNLLQQGA